jgi:hypothetical protein
MSNKLKLLKKGIIFVQEDFEGLALKFTASEEGMTCEAKRSHEKPYAIDPRSNLAFECLLGGDEITEEEYKKY